MRIHFIAIGGSIMHNLAIALQQAGHVVSGSDDEIYEPSRSRLARADLMPRQMGWHAEAITDELDVVILGMHARGDNPELIAATRQGIPVQSFPGFVADMSRDKRRVVIAGSHGKTTTTAMIMHALRIAGHDFDYLVGAQLKGFELSVRLSDAPVIILEGDEYLSSPLDRRPKFLHYAPHITVITGVAWDHMNVFPTYESYLAQFGALLKAQSRDSKIFAFGGDEALNALLKQNAGLAIDRYEAVPHRYGDGQIFATPGMERYPVHFFGQHNFQNMRAAQLVCAELGVGESVFFRAMQTFEGAAMRLEPLHLEGDIIVYRDFAHAPSKVAATVQAVRARYPERHLTAMLELHTYSSLNQDFLPLYKDTLEKADNGLVYYSPHTLEMKKLPPLAPSTIAGYFGTGVRVFSDMKELIKAIPWPEREYTCG